jgi:hypothetical protein
MQPEFSTYVSYSTDGTYVYSDVELDGYTKIGNTEYCNINGAIHTPRIYNILAGTGGWFNGSGQSPYNYTSFSNTQQSAFNPAQNYEAEYDGEMECSLIGTFYNTGFWSHLIHIGIDDYIREDYDTDNCYYIEFCTNGNTEASCPGATFACVNCMPTCSTYNYLWEYELVVDGDCLPVGIFKMGSGPHLCQ